MATFVLVQGSCGGGFYWRPVVRPLREAGQDVYTPTLTGVGERVHLARPDIDLETHVQDILGVLTYEDLAEVILVGHSYGGMVITGVADRAPERLAHLVYLDAVVPQDGESREELFSPAARAARAEAVLQRGEGWRLPVPQYPGDLGNRWPYRHFTAQPFKTFTQPLRLTDPARSAGIARTYILCTDKPHEMVAEQRAQLADRVGGPGWRYFELPTGHMAMLTMPQELVALVLDLLPSHEPDSTSGTARHVR